MSTKNRRIRLTPDPFLGKWFHSMGYDKYDRPNDLGWQGQIVAVLPDGSGYMVRTYSWLDGSEARIRKVEMGAMDGWQIYESDAEMRDYSQYFHKHIAPRIDRQP